MALEVPRPVCPRSTDDVDCGGAEDTLLRALRLAREIEQLLDQAPASPAAIETHRSAHSTRIARAVAASLIDELEAARAVARTARKGSLA